MGLVKNIGGRNSVANSDLLHVAHGLVVCIWSRTTFESDEGVTDTVA